MTPSGGCLVEQLVCLVGGTFREHVVLVIDHSATTARTAPTMKNQNAALMRSAVPTG